MSSSRSGWRALLGLALLACMFAAVIILAHPAELRRCLRSHRATAMQPLFASDCVAASCASGGLEGARLQVVGFRPVRFEACDAWARDGESR